MRPSLAGGALAIILLIADRLSRIWGRQSVVENKPGAGTNIGAAAVASSDSGGYTMPHLAGELFKQITRI